jgi:hypothetical protein
MRALALARGWLPAKCPQPGPPLAFGSLRARSRALAVLAALACGPGGGGGTAATPSPSLEADLASARLEVATLRQALSEERGEREALEAELERLRQELDELAWRDEAAGPAAGPGEGGAEAAAHPGRPWFDAEALARHGVPPAEQDALREAFDASELALLQLEDEARRGGWYDEPRYRQRLRDLRLELRAELGDERFDLLLFATGRHNRVVVTDLLSDSPAERAGVRPGDEILSYAERRIFRGMELKAATTEGEAGERVELVVLRDGSRERLWVPRGPLGIRMRPANRPPPW